MRTCENYGRGEDKKMLAESSVDGGFRWCTTLFRYHEYCGG